MKRSPSLTPTLIGGLTHNQRQRVLRLLREMRDATVNFYMRINDTDSRSLRSRTLSARVLAERAKELHRTVART